MRQMPKHFAESTRATPAFRTNKAPCANPAGKRAHTQLVREDRRTTRTQSNGVIYEWSFLFLPGVGQKTALRTLPTARNSTFSISSFAFHSSSCFLYEHEVRRTPLVYYGHHLRIRYIYLTLHGNSKPQVWKRDRNRGY